MPARARSFACLYSRWRISCDYYKRIYAVSCATWRLSLCAFKGVHMAHAMTTRVAFATNIMLLVFDMLRGVCRLAIVAYGCLPLPGHSLVPFLSLFSSRLLFACLCHSMVLLSVCHTPPMLLLMFVYCIRLLPAPAFIFCCCSALNASKQTGCPRSLYVLYAVRVMSCVVFHFVLFLLPATPYATFNDMRLTCITYRTLSTTGLAPRTSRFLFHSWHG